MAADASDAKECNICGAELEKEAEYCPECGADFTKEGAKYNY